MRTVEVTGATCAIFMATHPLSCVSPAWVARRGGDAKKFFLGS